MIVFSFNYVLVVLVLLESGNESAAQRINVQNKHADCSNKQYEARALNKTKNTLLKYQSNKQKENDSSRRKRHAIIPNLLGLGAELLSPPIMIAQSSPEMTSQMSPGINIPLSPGIMTQLSPEINAPLSAGITSQLRPGINIPLSPGIMTQLNPGIKAPLSPGITAQLNPGNAAALNPGCSTQLSPGIIGPLRPENNTQLSAVVNASMSPGNAAALSPGIDPQLSPGLTAPLSPGNNAQLSPGVNAPLNPGVNAQLSPGINLNIDKDIYNMKKQSRVSGITNSVKYPVQVIIIYPKDVEKDLNDTNTEQIEFNVDNINISSILDALNPIVIDSNNTKSLSNNKKNKTDVTSTQHKDDYYLKNDKRRLINNISEKKILHTNSKLEDPNRKNNTVPSIANFHYDNVTHNLKENESLETVTSYDYDKKDNTAKENICFPDETDNKEHESYPGFSGAEDEKKIRPNNYEIKPIQKQTKYRPLEKVNPERQHTNNSNLIISEETELNMVISEANNDGISNGLLYNENGINTISMNAPKVKYSYLSNFQYSYPEALPGKSGVYINYLNRVNNDNRNAVQQRYGNFWPAFKYPYEDQNTLTYQYQKTESTPENNREDKNFKPVNRENGKVLHEYTNIIPVFKYPIQLWKYQKPQTIPENYGIYNGNNLNYEYNKKRNYVLQDYRNIPSDLKYPLDTNNIQLFMPYKKWNIANQEYGKIRPAFQYQNINKYVRPENLAGIQRRESNRYIRETDAYRNDNNNNNNNPSIISRNFDQYYNNKQLLWNGQFKYRNDC